MIRVLVVDDDFRVADLHAQFVARVAGFEVVGVALTAAHAERLDAQLAPDLALLDLYLPDELGTALSSRLSADVIMITAATDPASVRTAFGRGALSYLVKPFGPAELAARLQAYARYRQVFESSERLSQADIDRSVRLLRSGESTVNAAPKGRSTHTAELIVAALRRSGAPQSAGEIANDLGISRATAQRYLSDLNNAGTVELALRYGSTGRPEHQYSLREPGPTIPFTGS